MTSNPNPRIALFTGTFDPFTIGHASIVRRALTMFDRLVVAVAMSKLKHAQEEIDSRVADIKALYADEPRVSVVAYGDLTVDLARREHARFIVRGVRDVRDFEYERQQADINRRLGDVETLILFTEPELQSVSSTLVRELRYFGHDASQFVPKKK